MAHFAKLGINGKVLSVEVVADADCQGADGTELESIGVDFLNRTHGWPLWAKTSYNTRGGKYYDADGSEASDQSKALRGNYAGIGYTWSEDENIFWPATTRKLDKKHNYCFMGRTNHLSISNR